MQKSNILLPPSSSHAFFVSLESIIGTIGFTAVLRYAGLSQYINNYPPDTGERIVDIAETSAIHAALETLYGWRGGKALIMNSGRETWRGLVARAQSGPIHDALQAILSAPQEERVHQVLNFISGMFNPSRDPRIELADLGDAFLYKSINCPSCWGRKMSKPGCHLSAGYLQEAVRWASGSLHPIEQTTCAGCGDELCSFKISKASAE